jgi:hypothetical protein
LIQPLVPPSPVPPPFSCGRSHPASPHLAPWPVLLPPPLVWRGAISPLLAAAPAAGPPFMEPAAGPPTASSRHCPITAALSRSPPCHHPIPLSSWRHPLSLQIRFLTQPRKVHPHGHIFDNSTVWLVWCFLYALQHVLQENKVGNQ